MARMITRAELAAAIDRFEIAGADILRRYQVNIAIVTSVDNEGAQCEYCAETDRPTVANVYVTDMDGQDHCVDTCRRCVVNVIDAHIDTNPDMPVLVEIAQASA